MGVAVDEARQHSAAGGVDAHVGSVDGFEGGDPVALQGQRGRVEGELAGAVVAQVGQAVGRRT
jgi:hypothetical protein